MKNKVRQIRLRMPVQGRKKCITYVELKYIHVQYMYMYMYDQHINYGKFNTLYEAH